MKKKRHVVMLVAGAGLFLALYQTWNRDYFRWPASAMERIEESASILRRLKAPARWCYPATSAVGNLWEEDQASSAIADCFSRLAPTSDFVEKSPREYVKRFYGANANGYICEVTLSTVWGNDRVVGSDCYYGIFRQDEFPGIGVTDEPFG